jgi:hypothetical protein
MSLVQVYETTNSQRFSAKFDTPIVIPKSGRITLTKAHIPRLRQLTIAAGINDTLGIQFHDEQPAAGLPRFYGLTIPPGNYTPQALCTAINAQFIALKQTWQATQPFSGQFAEANLRFTWDGAYFVVRASCDSVFLDFWAEYNSTLPNNNWDWRDPTPTAIAGQGPPLICDRAHAGRSIACTRWEDNVGQLSSWNNVWHEGRSVRRAYWDAYPDVVQAPSYQHPFSGGKWTNSIAGAAVANISSYWIGLSENDVGGIGVGAVTDSDIDTLTAVTGVDYCVMVCSDNSSATLLKGKAYVYEQNQTTGALIRQTSDASAAAAPDVETGDQICIVLPQNAGGGVGNHCEYWVRPVASPDWNTDNGAYLLGTDLVPGVRPIPAAGTQLYVCGGFYQDLNGVAGQQTIGHEWGFDPDCAFQSLTEGGGFFNHFGQRAQVYLADQDNRGGGTGVEGTIGVGDPPAQIVTTLGATMGFTQPAADLLFQSGGVTPLNSVLQAATAAVLDVPGDTRPLVNVNIMNLPIVAAAPSFENATTLAPPLTQHGFTRTVASIPRYGGTGASFLNEGEDEVMSYGDNTQTIKLRNVETIQLSSLDFELRNCDGTIPQDLGVPAAFVFQIDGKDDDDLI